ncbi:MAG: RlpA-like double-psi beta-barrel domain-containing protein [Patescibacteria group bacterium]
MNKYRIFGFVLVSFLISLPCFGSTEKKELNLYIDKETISKGYTVDCDGYLKLSLVSGILSEDTNVLIEEIPEEYMTYPWKLKRISATMQFEFLNKNAYDDHKPFYIQLSYDEVNGDYKQVFFYDKGRNLWRPLPTKDYPEEKFVRSLIHLPFARIAVFSYPGVEISGKASWYKYKNGDFTASTVYPKGSVLRVYNKSNNEFVDVTVNDFGPERAAFPDRVLDLDYVAFNKIAKKGEGVIDVYIEPLFIPEDSFGKVLGVGVGVNDSPEINSVSAILIKEDEWKSFFEKNPDKQMPVASLTKLLSTYVFLSNNNNNEKMEEIVSYSLKDEYYNHQYFNKWEVARINMNEGDKLSIKDIVYSALVRSANNVVETMVRVSGLERNLFIQKMNEVASSLELSQSMFFEPTGLDEKNVSTAREFALISNEAFKIGLIGDASVTKSYKFFTRNDNSLKLRYNSSDLVLNNNYSNFKIIGSKTGYINENSGYNLVSRADINGDKFIAVILNSATRSQSFQDMIELFDFAALSSVN